MNLSAKTMVINLATSNNDNEVQVEFNVTPLDVTAIRGSSTQCPNGTYLDVEHLADKPGLLVDFFEKLGIGGENGKEKEGLILKATNRSNNMVLQIDSNLDKADYSIDLYFTGSKDAEKTNSLYWNSDEIKEDPILVIGAVLGGLCLNPAFIEEKVESFLSNDNRFSEKIPELEVATEIFKTEILKSA
ncbi:hypothetical protein [Photobacterium kishitanii]|uniref:Uncharacterized protein n=1 Tax=Photobacterium kishitanii TaxID=318456 RepID=A0A2T3KKX3_9GAMM|nr:hypothetical protein [Photobacterium kishitanii]PSV00316.1 hypothetical protein C9J27_04110 [Photobacterium kishitanii]